MPILVVIPMALMVEKVEKTLECYRYNKIISETSKGLGYDDVSIVAIPITFIRIPVVAKTIRFLEIQ